MTTFHLVRHGQPAWAMIDERCYTGGLIDLAPLTPAGVAEIEAAAAALAAWAPTVVLASPMTRALQSAVIVGHRLGLAPVVELDLHEWLPDLTGGAVNEADVRAAYKDMEACGGVWPAGEKRAWEPRPDVGRRVTAVLARYRDHERVAVICHGVVIEALTGQRVPTGGGVDWRFGSEGT
jgi:broad specificity phosphatase PhoE